MEIKADKLVKTYVKIRDKRKELVDQYEKEDNNLKEALELIESELLEMCKETGADSLRTEFGHGDTTPCSENAIGQTIGTLSTNFLRNTTHWNCWKSVLPRPICQPFLRKTLTCYLRGLNVDSRYTVTVRRK
jgi:hypothetical protein